MTDQNSDKMNLAQADIAAVQKAFEASEKDFLDPKKSRDNVVGMGLGIKWVDGEPTGEPALVVLVTQKLEKAFVSRANRVPSKLEGMQTDVLSVGHLVAETLAERVRPAKGGYSVGHEDITAGTLGACVYDILPGGTISPPKNGIGVPRRYYILSNNHVLANSNDARSGDPILQPGPIDGGTTPADRIATLTRFIPISFNPQRSNLVDAAIAEGDFHDLDREIFWTGHVRGWRPRANVEVGTLVQKTGRTTNYTTGRITAINATVNVSYGSAGVARFRDQIIMTDMSNPGDSGSLITTLDNVAVGLLFAGSSVATIANQIENVRRLLRVEVAEQIL